MPPRLTDWILAFGTGLAFATGLMGNLTGRAEGRWVFVLHGVVGFALALVLIPKLRRVLPRLVRPSGWEHAMVLGALGTFVVLLTLVSGIAWVADGIFDLAGFNLLNWHITLGVVLVLVVSAHMIARAKPLRSRDLAGRREALRWLGIGAVAAAAWAAQARLAAGERRFTGSRPLGQEPDGMPNTEWPPTSWVADAPRPLDPARWRLRVSGHVQTALSLPYEAVAANDALIETLDCTGGFYTTQRWRGVRVWALLDEAGVRPEAGWVRFIAVTGYRWSLPLAEARNAVLATHTVMGAEAVPLSHGHGGPARLVAPGHRGFTWVKWLVAVEVLTAPDPGQALAIHTSSFTPAGRGEITGG